MPASAANAAAKSADQTTKAHATNVDRVARTANATAATRDAERAFGFDVYIVIESDVAAAATTTSTLNSL